MIGPFPPFNQTKPCTNIKAAERGCWRIAFPSFDISVDTKFNAAKGADLLRAFVWYSGPEDQAPIQLKNQNLVWNSNHYTRQQCEQFWAWPGNLHLKSYRKLRTGKTKSKDPSADAYMTTQMRNDVKQAIVDFLMPEGSSSVNEPLCDGEEPVAIYTKRYRPDYILSQLLSWHKGGIDVPDGLPVDEMTGCVSLPKFNGVYNVPTEVNSKSVAFYKASADKYEGDVKRWEAGKNMWLEADSKRRQVRHRG
jgi:hypothetical protein